MLHLKALQAVGFCPYLKILDQAKNVNQSHERSSLVVRIVTDVEKFDSTFENELISRFLFIDELTFMYLLIFANDIMSESCMHEISPLSYVIKMRLHVRFRSAFLRFTSLYRPSK